MGKSIRLETERRICPTCEGHEMLRCPECQGHGGIWETGGGIAACEHCMGDGTILCPDCDGTGVR